MQEEQPHPVAERLIEWTGERCVPWTGDLQVVYEHYHRYLLARPLVTGKRVLDLASGEGYGAALLAEGAATVVGVEIDPAAVAHSQQTYALDGLAFLEGSMLDLSQFADGSFDIVTCFEALEHVVEHEELLQGVRRVLTDDGVFLTSTPDRLVYTEELHQHNPHHVRELSLAEFKELLGGHFGHVRYWGQAIAVGSLIQPVDEMQQGGAQVLAVANEREAWVQVDAYAPTYYIAAASASALPDLPAQSVLVDVDLELVRSAQRAMYDSAARLASAQDELSALRAGDETAELRAANEKLHIHLRELDAREERARVQLGVLDAQLAAAKADLAHATVEGDLAALAAKAAQDESSRQTAALVAAAGETSRQALELEAIRGSKAYQAASRLGRLFR